MCFVVSCAVVSVAPEGEVASARAVPQPSRSIAVGEVSAKEAGEDLGPFVGVPAYANLLRDEACTPLDDHDLPPPRVDHRLVRNDDHRAAFGQTGGAVRS